MEMVELRYSEELHNAEKQLHRLKRRYAARRAEMLARHPSNYGHRQQLSKESAMVLSAKEKTRPDEILKQLLAECLLDPSAKPPVDSHTLHMKVRFHVYYVIHG